MSFIVCMGINLAVLAGIVWCLHKWLLRCKLRYVLGGMLVWLILFNAPISGIFATSSSFYVSLCGYMYALFDTPSFILILLSGIYLARFVCAMSIVRVSSPQNCIIESKHTESSTIKSYNPKSHAITSIVIESNIIEFSATHPAWLYSALYMPFFPPRVQYVWIGFGLVLYMGFLGYFVDIYHLGFKMQLFVLSILSIFSYILCARSGFLLLICMLAYGLKILGDMNIFNYCIDPFLWIGCIIAAILRFGGVLVRFYYGGKNGEKVA